MINRFTEVSYERWLTQALCRIAEGLNIPLLAAGAVFEQLYRLDLEWNDNPIHWR